MRSGFNKCFKTCCALSGSVPIPSLLVYACVEGCKVNSKYAVML